MEEDVGHLAISLLIIRHGGNGTHQLKKTWIVTPK